MDIYEYMRERLQLMYISDLRHLKDPDAVERELNILPPGKFSELEIAEFLAYICPT